SVHKTARMMRAGMEAMAHLIMKVTMDQKGILMSTTVTSRVVVVDSMVGAFRRGMESEGRTRPPCSAHACLAFRSPFSPFPGHGARRPGRPVPRTPRRAVASASARLVKRFTQRFDEFVAGGFLLEGGRLLQFHVVKHVAEEAGLE